MSLYQRISLFILPIFAFAGPNDEWAAKEMEKQAEAQGSADSSFEQIVESVAADTENLVAVKTSCSGPAVESIPKHMQKLAPVKNTADCCCDLFSYGKHRVALSGEFLYWKPMEGGTEFALPTHPSTSSGMIPGSTSPHYVSFQWEPGFRVGAKYFLPDKQWSFFLSAANLTSSVSSHLSGMLFPLYSVQPLMEGGAGLIDFATSADSHWKLNYWVFDLRWNYERPFCNNFLFIPFAGLKGALIHQHFHNFYNGVNLQGGGIENYSIYTRNNCNSVGLQGGLHGEWVLGSGFRLLGDCSLALVYGWFHVDQNQSGQAGYSNTVDFSSDFQRLLPAADLFAGFSWGRFFDRKCKHVEVHAGYQAQYWWRQNQSPRFIDSSSPYYLLASEDLGLQGLTLGGSFDF
ncbi:MAG: mOMP-like family protein [Parachlamydiales bacterium]|nr:mOMP-like family protein [Parachlamydiales bacterium]